MQIYNKMMYFSRKVEPKSAVNLIIIKKIKYINLQYNDVVQS